MNYLRKYFIKALFFASCATLLFIAVVLVAVNIYLSKSTGAIERRLSEHISRSISIKGASYLPPNSIIFRNVSVFKDVPQEQSRPISIEKIKLPFSLSKLITKRHFSITGITFNKPRADYSECVLFFKENIKQIIRLIEYLSKQQSGSFVVREALLSYCEKGSAATYINFNIVLRKKQQDLISSGSLSLERFSAATPFTYSFRGLLEREGLIIKNLELAREGSYVKLWGGMKKGFLKLNGFSMLDHPSADLNILDIDCLLRLAYPGIQIENLSFSLNDIPLRLKGVVLLCDPVLINLTVSSQGIESTLKNLSFYSPEKDLFKMSFEQATLSYASETNLGRLALDEFNASFNLRDEKTKTVEFNSKVYDGFLKGQGRVDVTGKPLRYSFDAEIKDVSAEKFDTLLSDFPAVSGTLQSRMHCKNYPYPNLNGEIIIENGYLDNVEFLNWLAQFFDIPSLQKVSFDELSATLLTDGRSVNLDKIALDSKDLTIEGYFSLSEEDLVSSRLSLSLSRSLLDTSDKFKPLLKLLKQEASYLNFDFQLSGLIQAMNFKWLDSDFKIKIRDFISAGMQSGIEKEVEDVIESISMK